MTIHNAADHGYSTEPSQKTVKPGDIFRRRIEDGIAEYEVIGDWHPGYCVVRLARFVTEPTRKSLLMFVGGQDTFTRSGIIADKYAA